MKEKIKEKAKKVFGAAKESATDIAVKGVEFQEEHPFVFGMLIAQVAIYWALVAYGLTHPNEELRWMKKQ